MRQYLGLPTKYSYDNKNAKPENDDNNIDFTKDFEDQPATKQQNP